MLPGTGKPVEPVAEGKGRVRLNLGGYTVTAEMDPAKPSYLAVQDQTQTSALVCGQAAREISLGTGSRQAKADGSTLLWEKEREKQKFSVEETDQLPPALIYGNRY